MNRGRFISLKLQACLLTLQFLLWIFVLPPLSIDFISFFMFVPLFWVSLQGNARMTLFFSLVIGIFIGVVCFYGALPKSTVTFLLIIGVMTSFFVIFFSHVTWLKKSYPRWIIFLTPAFWVLLEIALELIGLPWSNSVFVADSPVWLQLAEFGGQYILSYLIVVVNLLVAMGISLIVEQKRSSKVSLHKNYYWIAAVSLIFGMWGFGKLMPSDYSVSDQTQSDSVDVAVFQTNVNFFKYDLGDFKRQRNDIFEFVKRYNPDLALLPEVNIKVNTGAGLEIQKEGTVNFLDLIKDSETAWLLYTKTRQTEPFYHMKAHMVSIDKNAKVLHDHVKTKPVPLIENKLAPGTEQGIHRDIPGKPASLICIESALAAIGFEFEGLNPGLIAISTSDVFKGYTLMSELHFEFARIRAVESRKPVLRAANQGRSAIFDPYGNIISKAEYLEEAVLTSKIQPQFTPTFYVKYGYYIMRAFVLFLSSIMLISMLIFQFRARKTLIE